LLLGAEGLAVDELVQVIKLAEGEVQALDKVDEDQLMLPAKRLSITNSRKRLRKDRA
jgi:hypothetical protein